MAEGNPPVNPAAPSGPVPDNSAAVQPTARANDARLRLPREPYPGLRPFLDFEAALLFGRERQVREVIDGLRESQFVAVLGGSGSGKSSLVLAGVVPALRSFGIPGAGDLWLPLACTPGTNVGDADRTARRHTPITRLARRFAGLLKSRGSEAADQARLEEMAQVFRQEAGFARLLDAYAAELNLPPGPDPDEARVLFVLDQFEEVFHPTNKDVEDARLLVERVLDHFFNPHPRCHVVLTMRSEHLNDCAAFLELPDAINKSSYLIRRLDSDELRDAIVGPAQRFLRLVARSETSTKPLPAEVVFEPEVLQRLLRDVQSITGDPDHLPLLQHLLARLWEAALQREEMDTLVPAVIAEIDLVRAVNPSGMHGDEVALAPELNTLRACVNNWPESLYNWHGPEERLQLDALFRQLAFKDPNTGAYSQQRVDVDEAARQLGAKHQRSHLRTLVGEGFLGSVDYLFWDDEDPARVTLKVSHESFIRGWLRFRALVDADAVHFGEYQMVLRKCAEWAANQRSEDYLLETGEMRRLAGSGFVARLQDSSKRSAWSRLLSMDRDAVHLAQAVGEMGAFIQASEHRLEQRRLYETRGRRRTRLALVAAVGLTLLPVTLFSLLVQGPTMRRADLLFEAAKRADRVHTFPVQGAVGDCAVGLQSMLQAGGQVCQARTGAGPWRMEVSKGVLDRVGAWPPFSDQRDFIYNVLTQLEPDVNALLRQRIQSAIWRAPAAGSQAAEGETELPAAEVWEDMNCAGGDRLDGPGGSDGAGNISGRLFVQAREQTGDTRSRRALFVPAAPAGAVAAGDLVVYSASFDAASRRCTLGTQVLNRPAVLRSRVVFDAGLRLFYYTVTGPGLPGSLIVQELDWERGPGDELYAHRQTRASITDAKAIAAVHELAGEGRAAVARTFRVAGGRVVDMRSPQQVQAGEQGPRWFVANTLAQRLDVLNPAEQLQQLTAAAPGSACQRLAQGFEPAPGFSTEVLEDGQRCFRISRGWPAADADMPLARPVRDDVRVVVHDRPPSEELLQRASVNLPAPLASLLPFARIAPSTSGSLTNGTTTWWVGTSGALDGWLLMRVELQAPDGSVTHRYTGAPWSTCALSRLGTELLNKNPAVAARVGGPERGGTGGRAGTATKAPTPAAPSACLRL